MAHPESTEACSQYAIVLREEPPNETPPPGMVLAHTTIEEATALNIMRFLDSLHENGKLDEFLSQLEYQLANGPTTLEYVLSQLPLPDDIMTKLRAIAGHMRLGLLTSPDLTLSMVLSIIELKAPCNAVPTMVHIAQLLD